MLAKLVVSAMFLMALSACALGVVCLGMGVKESYKDKEWPGFFGMFACLMLLLTIGALLIVVWISILISGIAEC